MSAKHVNLDTRSVIETIDTIILKEINGLIYLKDKPKGSVFNQSSPYIKFVPLITSIEFLGACYDELPFYASRKDKVDLVESRFNKAIANLFDGKYLKYTKRQSDHYLYKFRCHMIHHLGTGPFVTLTTRKEAIEDGNTHLGRNEEGKLILVLEDFYDDLKSAAERIIRDFNSGKITNQKGEQAFMVITKYN